MSDVTGRQFRLLRAGGLGTYCQLIEVARAVAPGERELYPAWQGMQYMCDMYRGHAKLEALDNDRYPGMHWTTVRDVLSQHHSVVQRGLERRRPGHTVETPTTAGRKEPL